MPLYTVMTQAGVLSGVAAVAWRGGRSGGRKELADEKRPIGESAYHLPRREGEFR
jgi:hypothetical protein